MNDNDEVYTVILDSAERSVMIGTSSVIGKREEQQDAVKSDDDYAFLERGKIIAVLCDGMGGLSGGAMASQLSAWMLHHEFQLLSDDANIPKFLQGMVKKLDADVRMLKKEDGSALNAGTTLASVVIEDQNLYWVSVGDSRIYMIRGEEILCITQDHNYGMILSERVRKGEITAAEAENHPKKEALISYIGMGSVSYIDINVKPVQLLDGDIILLCSDGLYRTLDIKEIKDTIDRSNQDAQLAAQTLTDLAISKNKSHQDNTSVIVIQYQNHG